MENKCCRFSKKNIPSTEDIEKNVELLKALSDPTRLKIIYLLQEDELCACEIIDALGKSQSTLSHHLNLLRKVGIISGKKVGTWVHYKLAKPKILENLDNLFKN